MAVHKDKQWHIFFHCDECGEQALPDVYIAFDDFYRALDDIREAGWKLEQRYDDSRHGLVASYTSHRCCKCVNGIWP